MVNANEKERMSLRPSLMTAVGWREVLDLASNSNLKLSTSRICRSGVAWIYQGRLFSPNPLLWPVIQGPSHSPALGTMNSNTSSQETFVSPFLPSHPGKRAQGGLESLFVVH